MLFLHGDQLDHCLYRRQLVFAAEGHQHAACPDGRVKALAQAPFRAAVEVLGHFLHPLGKAAADLLRPWLRCRCFDADVLFGPVGVQKSAAEIDNLLSVPFHHEALVFLYRGHLAGLQVFAFRKLQEGIHVPAVHHHGHALLAFADGKLGPVQSLVLAGDSVQIDEKAFSQFADGDRDAAGAEVVAALDHPGCFRVPEQPLQLALFRRVAFLHLCAAGFDGLDIVRLAGARCAPDAVTAGTAPKQDDRVPGNGDLTTNIFSRCGCDDRADLHPLGGIAGVVELVHNAGGKADLVAIRGIARRRGRNELALRQLARDGFRNRLQRVGSAGNAHGAVNIGPARQRVTDGAADAGGGTAEGLDLGGVVVRFVFEQQQPGLLHAVRFNLDFDGAGIDFLRLIQLWELSGLFQCLDRHGGQVHQADGFGPPQVLTRPEIVLPGLLNIPVLKADTVDDGVEGGVTAVVRPVGVQHADFGDRGIPVLAAEIVLTEGNVIGIHGEAQIPDHRLQPLAGESTEAFQRFHFRRDLILRTQGVGFRELSFPRLHGVDDVFFDLLQFLFSEITVQGIDLGRADRRAFALRQDLDALRRRIRPLVELTGQKFHRKNCGIFQYGFVIDKIQLRLRKHGFYRIAEQFFRETLRIIAVEQADILQAFDAKQVSGLIQ